jgi:hypothetical protein
MMEPLYPPLKLENTVPHALFRNHRNTVLDGVSVVRHSEDGIQKGGSRLYWWSSSGLLETYLQLEAPKSTSKNTVLHGVLEINNQSVRDETSVFNSLPEGLFPARAAA